jgi:ABC-type sugar transport system ATPase subunit
VKAGSLAAPAATLSGGNQQKVLLGKWLATQPRVLLLDEPTRGVDVGAKAEIHARVRKLADGGMAVLVVSSELPEVIALSDRVLVMRSGAIAGELAGETATQEAILSLAAPESAARNPESSEESM